MDNTSPTNPTVLPVATPPVSQATPPPSQTPVQPSSVTPPQATPPQPHSSGKKPYTIFVIIGILVVLVVILAFLLPTLMRNKTEEPVNVAPTPVVEEATPTPTDDEADVSEGLTITITSPEDKTTVSTATVAVSGTTTPLSDVFVNDAELKANSAGNFSTTVTLDEGENTILVAANDADGNYAEKQITVTYEPAQ
ncbi:MAG: hypothetical protein HY428_01655 [Candidatus Levybacteria bacterium]|nr:hypothetical protein [Candidatus Levybacteria bacterium]